MLKGSKKFMLVLAAVCVLLLMFAACSKSDSAGKSAPLAKISALFATDKPWVPDFTQKFEKETGIPVELTLIEYNDIATKFVVSTASGVAAYDIVESDPSLSGPWVQAGYLEALDSYMEPIINDLIKPDLLAYNGKIYGMPWFMDAFFFLYNKEILKKAGFDAPPKTWEEYTAICMAIKDKGLLEYPVTMNLRQHEGLNCLVMCAIMSNGGNLFNGNTPVFNSPQGVQALQYIVDLNLKYKYVSPGSFSSNPTAVTTELAQGRSAFAFTWGTLSGITTDPEKSVVIGQIDVGLFPSKGTSYTVDGSETISITSNSKNKDAAWKYIEGMTSKEYTKEVTLKEKVLPPWKSLFQDKDLNNDNPYMSKFADQLKNMFLRSQESWYGEFSQIMQVEVISALNGEKTAEKALESAQAQTLQLIK